MQNDKAINTKVCTPAALGGVGTEGLREREYTHLHLPDQEVIPQCRRDSVESLAHC